MIVDKDKLFIADAFLEKHFDRLVLEWSVGDIKKCCRMREDGSCEDGGAMVGAFSLWVCSIEYLGGLLTGNTKAKGTGDRITKFVGAYLGGYNPAFITELRWSLLHFYSPHHFSLIHEDNILAARKYHLQKVLGTEDQFHLHLGCSVADLEGAAKKFIDDLWGSEEMRMTAFTFYQTHLPLMPMKAISLFLADNLANSNPSIAGIGMVPGSGTVKMNWDK
jgi:hypothetical protein